MTRRVFVVAAALLFTSACCGQAAGSSSCTTQIEWVNFIQVGATQYVAGIERSPVLQETDLGPVYARVKFKVSGNVCDPNYRIKDGDAAFLDPGTAVYQINSHAVGEELAARFSVNIVVYRAITSAA